MQKSNKNEQISICKETYFKKNERKNLFFNQNRNLEENKRIKNKFIGFMKEEKDDNKNLDVNNTNKSDVD